MLAIYFYCQNRHLLQPFWLNDMLCISFADYFYRRIELDFLCVESRDRILSLRLSSLPFCKLRTAGIPLIVFCEFFAMPLNCTILHRNAACFHLVSVCALRTFRIQAVPMPYSPALRICVLEYLACYTPNIKMHPRPRLTAVIRMRPYGSMPTLRASSVLPQNCWSASFSQRSMVPVYHVYVPRG